MELKLLIILALINTILLIAILVLQLRKKPVKPRNPEQATAANSETERQTGTAVDGYGVVFCKNCNSQFSANDSVCPNCKTARK